MSKRILMIVTSHDRINEEVATGLWYEEFAEPYLAFQRSGYDITVASPRGGAAPIDPRSLPEQPDADLMAIIESTKPLAGIAPTDFDAVFLPGGHGTMFDLPVEQVGSVIGAFADANKVIGAVCHGPAGLVAAEKADGTPVVQGYRLTAFTNAEEEAVELTDAVPFLLESKLKELGAIFSGQDNFTDHVIVDRNLVTGQNPQSSISTANAVIRILEEVHTSV